MKNTKNNIKQFLHDAKAVSPAIATLILIVIAAVAAAGVGILVQSSQKNAQDQTGNKNMDAMGTLNIKGSTTVQPISQAAAIEFMKNYPAVTINVQGGGSDVGLVSAWTTENPNEDIGASSSIWSAKTINGVILPSREDAVIQMAGADAKVYETKIGTGMITVAYNIPGYTLNVTNGTIGTSTAAAGVVTLTDKDLEAAYGAANGQITVGSVTIQTVQRADPSGTEENFAKWIGNGLQDGTTKQLVSTSGAVQKQGNQGIRDYISTTPNTIGFVDFGFTVGQVNGAANVNAAKMNGTAPSSSSKGVGGTYDTASKVTGSGNGLARDLYYYTQGLPTGAIKAYLDWIMTPDGQKIVQQEGYFSS